MEAGTRQGGTEWTRGRRGGRRRRGRGRGASGERSAEPETVGALDLGTNNCRLLVAQPTGAGFRVVDAFSKVVQLGEGLSSTRALSEPAMRRTLDALGTCAAKLRRRRVTRLRAVATEACRRAGNAEQFVARVKRETGLDLEIIGPAEEARLAIAGCLPLIDRRAERALIFDIGGGSTQIAWIALDPDRRAPPTVLGAHSVPLGVVGVSEFLAKARDPARRRAEIAEVLSISLDRFGRMHGIEREIAAGRVQMIGASGTVTTLGGIAQGLTRYDRARVDGAWLDFAAIGKISAKLAALDPAARAAHPCVGRDRSGLVLAGCLIVEALCAQWPVGRLRVADRGLREGILLDLMARGPEG